MDGRKTWVLGTWWVFSAAVFAQDHHLCARVLESEPLVALTQFYADRYLSLPVGSSVNLNPGGQRVWLRTPGTPIGAQREHARGRIYRHYTNNENVGTIRRERRLRAGVVPYIDADAQGWYSNAYTDMNGVFVTLPEFTASQVSPLPDDAPYVDLHLPDDVGLLHLAPGIFLVPGPPGSEVPIYVLDGSE